MRIILNVVLFLLAGSVTAQKLTGTVFNEKGERLPNASVLIKGTTSGASANGQGEFVLNLRGGKYTLICQYIGYAAVEKTLVVTGNTVVDFVLHPVELSMQEVVVKSNGEDPAYEIIRQAIKKREHYHRQVDASIVDRYNKDVIRLRRVPKKILGAKIKPEDLVRSGLDSGGKGVLYLSEGLSKIYADPPDKFKMEVLSSRVSGSNGFGFSFPVVISLYTNNVKVFSDRFNPRGFVSPIADGAIGFYKFKFLGTFFEDGKAINSIRVTPRRTYEPLFSGTINITDGDWRIHSFDLLITKKAQLELLDTLSVSQLHVPVSDEVWQPKNQVISFAAKFLGVEVLGNFVNVYSSYNIAPVFDKKTFDNVLIRYDTAVTSKERNWWDTIRPVPLEDDEVINYQFKDSVFDRSKDSLNLRQNQDSLRKWQGKIRSFSLILPPGLHRVHYAKKKEDNFRWGVEPLLLNSEYNPVEGLAISLIPYYMKRFGKNELVIEPVIRYGFYNDHLNPSLNIELNRKQRSVEESYQNRSWLISGGKRVTQFNRESPISPLVNTVSTLFYGKNYMKIYENYFGSLYFKKTLESGLAFKVGGFYEDRLPLENNTMYTVHEKDSKYLTPNYPVEKLNANFTRHQALVLEGEVSFQPGQRYIQFPKSKMAIGSKYPTFSLKYARGIDNLAGSDVNFDKWNFDIYDTKNLKLAGTMIYKVGVGGFLNDRAVPIQDYQHFNGNLTSLLDRYVGSFQMASYYANSNTASFFARGHLEYHLFGLITNKIPLFKRLNWHLVTGGNAFYVNENSNYLELFVGLENIFKVLRVDFIAAYENGRGTLTGVKFGVGGLFGDRVKDRTQGRMREKGIVIQF